MKKLIYLFVLCSVITSCEKKTDSKLEPAYDQPYLGYLVYKIKDKSYFNYVTVMVNENATRIIAVFGEEKDVPEIRKRRPIELDSSFYYEPQTIKKGNEGVFTFGDERTAIVDIKMNDYKLFHPDTMMKHLISADLFTEFYESDTTCVINFSTTFEHDTALLNSWIRKGELNKYIKRLK